MQGGLSALDHPLQVLIHSLPPFHLGRMTGSVPKVSLLPENHEETILIGGVEIAKEPRRNLLVDLRR
jgi:hypothetical protein